MRRGANRMDGTEARVGRTRASTGALAPWRESNTRRRGKRNERACKGSAAKKSRSFTRAERCRSGGAEARDGRPATERCLGAVSNCLATSWTLPAGRGVLLDLSCCRAVHSCFGKNVNCKARQHWIHRADPRKHGNLTGGPRNAWTRRPSC
jgi:hypothetical protein